MSHATVHTIEHDAMAADWRIQIAGRDACYARQAAEAAFAELDRIELALSRFVPASDVSAINDADAREPVRVGVDTWRCLRAARAASRLTGGAFDVTVAGLPELWKHGEPDVLVLSQRMACVGLHHLRFDRRDHAVIKDCGQTAVDLGGIGKGYGVDRIIEVLADWSIESALVSAGGSTARAVGAPPGESAWTLALRDMRDERQSIATIRLRDSAVSGSGQGRHGTHILDPVAAMPPSRCLNGAWATSRSATLADALSTAFAVMLITEVQAMVARRSQIGAAVQSGTRMMAIGQWDWVDQTIRRDQWCMIG